ETSDLTLSNQVAENSVAAATMPNPAGHDGWVNPKPPCQVLDRVRRSQETRWALAPLLLRNERLTGLTIRLRLPVVIRCTCIKIVEETRGLTLFGMREVQRHVRQLVHEAEPKVV